ncbi:uncharacterized protein BDCG_16389 [Blastomyces dermatitidis ER-3]|uniref:Uncharacterized protein n=3 Tax=Blastomyces TaxID=229219 RepID=A0A179ULY0_BLAGS|nr:uncharacterized protein BDBG_17139 [Blastomyces gilchristii SLH14081]XP_045279666.1 uncharacterized protein BDCG_16389 [Blastomyces dermatitidis ER-3]EQL37226.1 hypothetical protein BDFG_01487 [Blastomyces dermatitidis ATCC 26199]KMW66908.1 hypothetical protein BDDG_11785 [Blastomyces dermatitidis ATCC 18188]OAS99938.1 hypothetical protein BDCG_16389 [Blastomyces dermatitidis ER-3]OAT08974.1 hypothetical protein BDBG_17139 [Blastomyces gilchristii SLH14081]
MTVGTRKDMTRMQADSNRNSISTGNVTPLIWYVPCTSISEQDKRIAKIGIAINPRITNPRMLPGVILDRSFSNALAFLSMILSGRSFGNFAGRASQSLRSLYSI